MEESQFRNANISSPQTDGLTTSITKNGPMREFVTRILSEYAGAKQTHFAGHPLGSFFRKDIPNAIYSTGIVNEKNHKISGSVGQGNWATIPWVGIFDRRITTSAQSGVYIVYLLSQDGNSLYLTFNQGCTEIKEKAKSKRDTIDILQDTSRSIRENINSRGFKHDDGVVLGNNLKNDGDFYQKGAIFYKEYRNGNVPDENELRTDLINMMQIYAEYVDLFNPYNEHKVGSSPVPAGDDGGEVEMLVKDAITKIKDYIAARGFSYEEGLIENFYLCLKSKPFVILAGTSGTGKTRLVRLFAEAIGATVENGRYQMVAVRPDWSDSTDLFGYVDLNGKFIPGLIIDFVEKAERDIKHPYFLCLDEMNLARVEYYLSDVLSIIETREFDGDSIKTDPLISKAYYRNDISAYDHYGTIYLPENLYIVGTVNMDETTFPFSRKVLDRANTIEFSHVDLTPRFEDFTMQPSTQSLENSFLKTEYLLLSHCADDAEAVEEICSELQDINNIMSKAGAHVGYRVRDEIVFYILNNKKHELLSNDEAMDNEITQKILPRIQGSSVAVKNMLCDLFKHCAGDFDGYQTADDDISTKMIRATLNPDCKYKKSAAKIAYMVRRYEEDGFTSYWL